jgi:hypothetical protein
MSISATNLRALLYDDPDAAPVALAGAVRDAGGEKALGKVAERFRGAALDQVGGAAAELLDLDLADVLGAAWRQRDALLTAANETVRGRETEKLVETYGHDVTFPFEPSVDVLLHDVPVITFVFAAELKLHVKGLIAVIRSGYLTELRAGTCEIIAKLQVNGIPVVDRPTTLDLPATLRLGHGIRLAGHAA